MAGVAQFLDKGVVDKSNQEVNLNDEKYKGKIIGLYFSAHWCPPCRGFTPNLCEFYNKYHETKNFEIIFISSDRDQDSFNEYYGEMPWLALDFNERQKKNELAQRFQVTGIPKFVLLDGDTGEVICENARTEIGQNDPNGENFPWQSSS